MMLLRPHFFICINYPQKLLSTIEKFCRIMNISCALVNDLTLSMNMKPQDKRTLDRETLSKGKFIQSFAAGNQLPNDLPEVAFLGRSNSGKSTLLSSLIHNASIVKTSGKPGSTTTVNYFQIGGIYLVDLPGYGYAKRSKNERGQLQAAIDWYLANTKNLVAGFLLLDCLRSPEEEEFKIAELFAQNHKPLSLLLSKADRLNQKETSQVVRKIKEFENKFFEVQFISAAKGKGIAPLVERLNSLGASSG